MKETTIMLQTYKYTLSESDVLRLRRTDAGMVGRSEVIQYLLN